MHHGTMLHLVDARVAPEWLDYNGHMNDAAYAIVFSRSVDALMDRIGIDAATRSPPGPSVMSSQMRMRLSSCSSSWQVTDSGRPSSASLK